MATEVSWEKFVEALQDAQMDSEVVARQLVVYMTEEKGTADPVLRGLAYGIFNQGLELIPKQNLLNLLAELSEHISNISDET